MQKIRSALAALTFVLPFALASTAAAQFHVGPIASAMGGAGRAATEASESSFLNPAALSHISHYNVDVGYQHLDHPVEGQRTEYSALIADGNEDRVVPGSLSFVHRFTEPSPNGGAYTEQDFQAAISGFAGRQMSIGIAAHRQLYMPSVGEAGAQNNVTLGALWAVSPTVGIGLVASDLIPSDARVPQNVRQTPTYALGSQMILASAMIHVRADLVHPTEGPHNGRNNLMLGLETKFRPDFVFRLGTQWDETEDKMLVSTGLGFHGPRLSVEYAFQKDVRVQGGIRQMIDLWLPL